MLFRRLITLAGAGVAAGALALTAGTAAFAGPAMPPVVNFSVSAPGSITGTAGTPLASPTTVDYSVASSAPFLNGPGVTFKSSAAGLDGLTFTADDVHHHDVISGTPSAASPGPVTVTVVTTVPETIPGDLPNLSGTGEGSLNRPDCSYVLTGKTSFTVDTATVPDGDGDNGTNTVGITGLTLDPKTGVFSYTVTDTVLNSEGAQIESSSAAGSAYADGYVISGPDQGSNGELAKQFADLVTVDKVCSDSVVIPMAIAAAPAPTPTPSQTPPPTITVANVPSGSVATGGGLPVARSEALRDTGFGLISLAVLTAGGGVFFYRRARQGS